MAKRKAWQSKLTGKQKQHAREWLVPNEGLFNRALVLQRAKESKHLGCDECRGIVARLDVDPDAKAARDEKDVAEILDDKEKEIEESNIYPAGELMAYNF